MFGTVIVPVTPLGTGLVVGEAPTCRPFGPTGAPGTVPSEEVTPSEGVAVSTWANAGLQHKKGNAVATNNNGLMEGLPDKRTRLARRGGASTAISKPAGSMTFIFITADRGWIL
jgi:hypothetical protein